MVIVAYSMLPFVIQSLAIYTYLEIVALSSALVAVHSGELCFFLLKAKYEGKVVGEAKSSRVREGV